MEKPLEQFVNFFSNFSSHYSSETHEKDSAGKMFIDLRETHKILLHLV